MSSTRCAAAPPKGSSVELFSIGPDGARLSIARTRTNADGRTDAPLISAAEARIGTFELVFHIGDYFRRSGAQDRRAGLSRCDPDPILGRRPQGALPRAAAGEPLELFDLSGQLDAVSA